MVVVVVLDFGCLRCVWGVGFLCFVLGIRLVDLVFCFGVCRFFVAWTWWVFVGCFRCVVIMWVCRFWVYGLVADCASGR